jgi:hypothetical protein
VKGRWKNKIEEEKEGRHTIDRTRDITDTTG